MCEILLENQADVDHADKEGKSALFAAASMGHLDIVNILLFWGCYADGIDCEGRTVLSVAAAEGSAGVVQVCGQYFLNQRNCIIVFLLNFVMEVLHDVRP